MAENTANEVKNKTKKTTTAKTATKKATKKTVSEKSIVEENQKEVVTPKKNPLTKDTSIKVISNVFGQLIYVSPNGMVNFQINDYGGYDYVDLGTLLAMRNANRRFFEENWIVIGDGEDYTAEDVYKFLRVSDYYKEVYSPDNINKLFNLDPSEIERIIKNYPTSLKQSIYMIAKQKYANDELKYISTIRAIENAVGLKLDEE